MKTVAFLSHKSTLRTICVRFVHAASAQGLKRSFLSERRAIPEPDFLN
jgi:hypothetical protein